MVTEAVGNWFLGLVATVIGWVPSLPSSVADNLGTYEGRLDQVVEQVSRLSPIIPFDSIAAAGLTLSAFLVFALMMQVTRIVISIATLGGGSV